MSLWMRALYIQFVSVLDECKKRNADVRADTPLVYLSALYIIG